MRLQGFHICAVEFSVATTEEAQDACSKEVNEEVDEHEARVVGKVRFDEAVERRAQSRDEQDPRSKEYGGKEGSQVSRDKVLVE